MLIGLTGGIGSGKTTVAKLFETMGFAIYNSDDRAKEMYYNPAVKKQIVELLGAGAYINETSIDTAYIAGKIFKDKDLLAKINAVIHPAVKLDFTGFINQQAPQTFIIKETALLFEAGIYKELDCSILVTAPHNIKIERVQKRSRLLREEIEKRIAAQWSDEQKMKLADFVILNDGSKAMIPQALQIISQLKNNVKA